LKKLIETQLNKGKKVAAICAAPSILGKMGALKNKEAVCYPGFESQLTGARIPQAKIAKSDNILTAKGPGVAIPFCFEDCRRIKKGNRLLKRLLQL